MTGSRYTYFTYPMPHGPLTIGASQRGVRAVAPGAIDLEGTRAASAFTNQASTQIQEYLAGKRTSFDVPLDVSGSDFARAVWRAAGAIPYGQTMTVAQLAESMGKPGGHRSVGAALKRNPLPILIPTHRVIAPSTTGDTLSQLNAGLRALEQRFAEPTG